MLLKIYSTVNEEWFLSYSDLIVYTYIKQYIIQKQYVVERCILGRLPKVILNCKDEKGKKGRLKECWGRFGWSQNIRRVWSLHRRDIWIVGTWQITLKQQWKYEKQQWQQLEENRDFLKKILSYY